MGRQADPRSSPITPSGLADEFQVHRETPVYTKWGAVEEDTSSIEFQPPLMFTHARTRVN